MTTTTNTTETLTADVQGTVYAQGARRSALSGNGTVMYSTRSGNFVLASARIAATFEPDAAPTTDDREVICSQFLDTTIRLSPESTYDAADDPYATEYDR